MHLLYNASLCLALTGLRVAGLFSKKIRFFLRSHHTNKEKIKELSFSVQDTLVWFHCASLGEFEQCRPLIEKLKKEQPEFKVLITFFSPSGYTIQSEYDLADAVCYLPFDTLGNVSSFLDQVQPDLAIFVKYEFWPNYLWALSKREIPIFSVSARFYPSQIYFKQFGKWLLKQLRFVENFYVQDEVSKKLLNQHGFENVLVSGDTRMDRVLSIQNNCRPLPKIASFLGDKSCFIGGSIWDEDYKVILPFLLSQDEYKVILVPHVVAPRVVSELERQIDVPFAKWSSYNPEKDNSKAVMIVDSIGLLSQMYRYATLSYVGGAMGSRGLHNILEPAVFGIPVIIGKNYSKFSEAVDLVEAGGVFSVSYAESFRDILQKLNSNQALYEQAGRVNVNYIRKKSGATSMICREIFKILDGV